MSEENDEIPTENGVEEGVDGVLTASSSQIDSLTMELLINRNHYKKYLSKTDATRYADHCVFEDHIRQHRDLIMEAVEGYLNAPATHLIEGNMDVAWKQFADACITHFQWTNRVGSSERGDKAPENEDYEGEYEESMPSQFGRNGWSNNMWGKAIIKKR